MRASLLLTLVHLAAVDTQGPDRLTPIVVAVIAAVSAIATALIAVFARQPDNRIPVLEQKLERRNAYIEDLRDQLWQHQIRPVDPPPEAKP